MPPTTPGAVQAPHPKHDLNLAGRCPESQPLRERLLGCNRVETATGGVCLASVSSGRVALPKR